MQNMRMEMGERSYGITVGKGILSKVGELFNLDRKIFILTDSGVPARYSESIETASKDAVIYTVPMGEGSKSFAVLEGVLAKMMDFDMGRGDALVAVGGGVVGDLGGFAAAVYMRGIDFYSIPTTVLSCVDSSIGGKTAVNFGGVKNVIGAFHQPRGVLIDTELLKTLPKRQFSNGLAEVVKMAATFDEALFVRLEQEGLTDENTEEIIVSSLKIKKHVVECDEKEGGLRKVLNFGHTLGHGIEGITGENELYHGECVALGIPPVCAPGVRERVVRLCEKLGLPMSTDFNLEAALALVAHDKKCQSGEISVIKVEKIGSYKIEKMSLGAFGDAVRESMR